MAAYPASEEYRLQDILRIFSRWRWLALGAFLCVVIPGAAVTLLMPPMYEATATLLVNRLGIAPAFPVRVGPNEAMPVLRSVNREEDVKTVAEMIRTRAMAEDVVAALAIDRARLNRIEDFRRHVQAAIDGVLDAVRWLGREAKYALGLSSRPTPEQAAFSEREDLLDTVANRVRVNPVPDTNILRVSFRSSDPALAQAAINHIVAEFVRSRQRLDRGSREHFDAELEQARGELQAAERALAEFRRSAEAYAVATQRDLLLRGIEQLRAEVVRIDALRMQRRATAEALRERIRAEPQFGRELQRALIDAEVELTGLGAQLATLREGIAAREAEMARLNEAELRLRELERAVARGEEAVLLRQRNYEQARLVEGMGAAELREVRLVDPASYPLSPVRPRTLLYLGIALGAGLLAAIALPFVAHLNDTTVDSERDVARLLDLHLVTNVPRLSGRRAREALATDVHHGG